MAYSKVSDTRNTSNGMTPNKSIKRPTNDSVKKPLGNYNAPMKSMRLNPGKRGG